MKRRTKQGDLLSSLLFNTVPQIALKNHVERWQKSKGMGIRLGDYESECLTNLRLDDDVFCAAPKHDVPIQAEYCECRIEKPPGQDETSEQPKYQQKKKTGDQQY